MVKNLSLTALLTTSSLVASDFKVDTNIRVGYEVQDGKKQDSIGGKVHIEKELSSYFDIGAAFYTTNTISHDKEVNINLLDSKYNSYSILGEAYLKAEYKNTSLKIGRQEIDTPFLDTDDIGMIPNTFEAGVLINKDLADTTIFLAKVQKWAGVDSNTPSKFSDIDVKTLGIVYEGFKNTAIQAWQYDIDNHELDSISYLEAIYMLKKDDMTFEVGGQYALQDYTLSGAKDATVSGITASVGFDNYGLTFISSYNKSQDNIASNGFGGGPYFTSCEHLTIAEAGNGGKATRFGIELEQGNMALELSKITLKNSEDKKATELDFRTTYTVNDDLSVEFIYSDTDDRINNEKFKNTRVFVNYNF